jgi:hypothetical protein
VRVGVREGRGVDDVDLADDDIDAVGAGVGVAEDDVDAVDGDAGGVGDTPALPHPTASMAASASAAILGVSRFASLGSRHAVQAGPEVPAFRSALYRDQMFIRRPNSSPTGPVDSYGSETASTEAHSGHMTARSARKR